MGKTFTCAGPGCVKQLVPFYWWPGRVIVVYCSETCHQAAMLERDRPR